MKFGYMHGSLSAPLLYEAFDQIERLRVYRDVVKSIILGWQLRISNGPVSSCESRFRETKTVFLSSLCVVRRNTISLLFSKPYFVLFLVLARTFEH